jgi:hypothetical protein
MIYGIGTCPVFEVTPLGNLVEGEVVAGRIAEKISQTLQSVTCRRREII